MISTAIQQLVNYGLDTGLILPDDEIYIRNQLLMTMQLDDFTAPEGEVCYTDLESILKTLVDDAVARGVCEDNSTARDLFDTKLMGVLTPRPSIVRANFEERYESEGPQAATDWFYEFSQDTDYIRRYRIPPAFSGCSRGRCSRHPPRARQSCPAAWSSAADCGCRSRHRAG